MNLLKPLIFIQFLTVVFGYRHYCNSDLDCDWLHKHKCIEWGDAKLCAHKCESQLTCLRYCTGYCYEKESFCVCPSWYHQ
eukprot:00799.XXX_2327_2036_1 [CDS] Oithona nana genome sequencing.